MILGLSESGSRAVEVLNAWRRHDRRELEIVLDRAGTPGADRHATDEQERSDLLAVIAEELRRSLSPGSGHGSRPQESVDTCLRLLEHLSWSALRAASCPPRAF